MNAKQKRLNIIILMLNLTRTEIAENTGYTVAQVSRITGSQEPTNKFINAFCNAYPQASKKFILENDGEPLNGVDCSEFGFVQNNDTVKVNFLQKQIETLTAQVNEYKKEISFFKSMLEKAMSIQPDLAGKLNFPVAKHGKKEKTPVFNLFSQQGTIQGTFGN